MFPGVPLTREVGEFGTLLANDRAREVIGFEPRHSWRDHVSAETLAVEYRVERDDKQEHHSHR